MHMTKLGVMLVKHKIDINDSKDTIGLKIEEKVKINIVNKKVYTVSPFMVNFLVMQSSMLT